MITLEAINQTINIGADKPCTVKTLAEVVAREFSGTPEILFLPAGNEVRQAYADHSKARRIFNIQHTVMLDEGIKKMAQWAKKVGARKGQGFKNIELTKNMPGSWKELIES